MRFKDWFKRKQIGEFITDHYDIRFWLDSWGIENFSINDAGIVDVNGDVDLSAKGLTRIPVQFGEVDGYFFISGNKLTSLKGSPRVVRKSFRCRENKLSSLEGMPEMVGHVFDCSENMGITSFKTTYSKEVGYLKASATGITSLEGISDDFKHLPEEINLLWHEITRGGIGLLLITGHRSCLVNTRSKPFEIIEKYLGNPDDIFECQAELIDAGFEEYAIL